MDATFRPLAVQDAGYVALAGTAALAGSIGREMAARWPHAIRRIRLAVLGALAVPASRNAAGEALMCGLSGLAEPSTDPRKHAAIIALNQRMMAIRLNGRTLVAFTPGRDISFKADTHRLPASRVTARAWSANGQWLGDVERAFVHDETEPGTRAVAGLPHRVQRVTALISCFQ